VISVAQRWHRPASFTWRTLAALAACGLLGACTEAPKLAKAPSGQPPSIEAESTRPSNAAPPETKVPPQAQAPAPEAAPPQAEYQDRAPSEAEEQRNGESYHSEKKSARPSLGAGRPADVDKAPGGSGEMDSAQRQDEPSAGAAIEPEASAPPPPPVAEKPSEPSGGSAAPAPPPSPAPVAAAPPPAAPATAARAAVESDPNKKYKVVPVFYGTDREIEPDPNRLQFGAVRGHKLQLGRALITVPLSHQVPHIERPREYEVFGYKIYAEKEDPDKHFTVEEIKALTEEQMLALVRERLAKSATFKDHAFVFIHGFNTSFDCALYRTAQITYDLGFDGAPFVYSWPSGGKVASYTYDRGSVEQAEPMLAEFLTMVIQKSGAKSISLIAHSMGNELLLRVLQTLKPKIPKGVVISQVILAAPDVDRDKFNIIAREISNFAKGVTLYAASNDRALGYSARFWGGVPRAGDIPKDGPLIIPGVDTIDVTAVSTDALGLNHSGYAENPALLDDVKALVEYGIRPPNVRLKSILAVDSPSGTFWRFQPTQ
jgi:esterase/lipase superfamily enzyme